MHACANGQVADHRSGNLQRVDQGYGALAEDRQGAGKTRRLHCPKQRAQLWQPQQQRVPAQPQVGLTQRPLQRQGTAQQHRQQRQAVAAQAVAQGDHGLGQHGQGLAAVDEDFHHVRHHIAEQETDDGQRGEHQDHRVDHRQLDFLP
ncbi:hypothetical protein D9M70_602650 [compost metagenome]